MTNLLAKQTSQALQVGLVLVAIGAIGTQSAWTSFGQHQRQSTFAARRAADDSRPLVRVAPSSSQMQLMRSESQNSPVVMGRFRAPAPERMQQHRVPKSSQFGTQIMSASYQVADANTPDKVVHGISSSGQRQRVDQRTVGAKMMVSDEGLNYPPSKLSADIYGNVAEIVTAPPEAVESDFLIPNSRRFLASRP